MTYFERIPTFKLYGSPDEWPTAEMLHCETIAARSCLNNWHIRPHRHASLYQILYLHEGDAWVQLEDERRHVRGPTALEIPPSCAHGYEFHPNCGGHVISVTTALLARLMQGFSTQGSLPSHPILHDLSSGEGAGALREACIRLQALYESPQGFREIRLEAWLTLLFAQLREDSASNLAPARHSRGLQHYDRFGTLLEAEYANHHKVAWYAGRLGLTAAHLTVVTRAFADKTPLGLIHERLALEASHKLMYTSRTISEIADALGFSEPAHFTRFFRRMSGESPRTFRSRTTQPA